MSETPDKQQQTRRFHIPTVEEIEKAQEEANRVATTISLPQPASHTPPRTAPAQTPSPRPAQSPRYANTTVLVNELQRGNPVLACIRNVRWSYSRNIAADYVVGQSACILYLSIKYHRLHPEYISKRIEKLGKGHRLRVLLVHVDTEDCKLPLREINRTAALSDVTLLLAWSLDEAGRHSSTARPDMIRERIEDSYMARLTNTLTDIRSVTKADVLTLSSNFSTLEALAKASVAELTLCPGIGDLKAKRIHDALNQPFISES
ncbi:excision repair cross-complementing rodent repair deficiency, complementation group 1 [Linderina pennispora]|uniref:Excision repair cross-complementing rodent repair deficiency, complementation group 1 n=1 Tax=Linderina pennispora TaxID=61395 RepID=A0A1Y1W3D1_9FUNG|nr:excision repair cross-complementing rodent repair deficiency, complementation group 1 [Linderina pennispora]ORX68049.1 excision repair cross-complementing rodent repair deficiency, complementation group 1 [Linderina pennispora]